MSIVTVVDQNNSSTIVITGQQGPAGPPGPAGAGASTTPLKKSASYTLAASDNFIIADATSGGFNLTLPTASSTKAPIYIVAATTTTNVITLKTQGGALIDNVSSILLGVTGSTGQYKSVTVVSDGTNWWVM